jgi:hypothetical protein
MPRAGPKPVSVESARRSPSKRTSLWATSFPAGEAVATATRLPESAAGRIVLSPPYESLTRRPAPAIQHDRRVGEQRSVQRDLAAGAGGRANGAVAGPVWDYQTLIAPWFSMVLCDTQSFPEANRTCTPASDSNIQVPPRPDHAGAAFMEVQLYPPGYSPFISRISCDQVHWCAALTIASLQANFDFSIQNPNCTEPVNFAFLTHGGVPVGPPGPDQANASTFTPAWAAWTAHTINVSYTVELGHFETPDLGGGTGEGRSKEEGPCFNGPTIPGCLGFFALDLDFDGFSYKPDWPNGTASYPTPLLVSSPESQRPSGAFSAPFKKSQFETDMLVIQFLAPGSTCNPFAGTGCSLPPPGADFYPWFHLAAPGGTCAWTLSNDGIPNQIENFGGESVAWGPPELTDYGGGFVAYENFASGAKANPCP